ncbi:ABC transporter substrate-binding protein [Ornithinibacillus sp. 4-3]|uniref:ABC transporter substrate-binding protein n=1 Tax=Ornithinibacillus sp. 4-3 TaxID=3231488 RepID=A0AB39HPI7_9BACI
MRLKNYLAICIFVLSIPFFLAACAEKQQGDNKEESNEEVELDTELNVAMESQPVSLDPLMSPSGSTVVTTRNIYEALVTLDTNYEPVLMLADSVEVEDDGKRYIFKLREGVTFHNGEEMTAEDVVASMNRWLGNSSRAKTLLTDATFEEVEPYTVALELPEIASDVLYILAGQGQFPAIMPKEIVEAADTTGVTEYIGTGPFMFEEYKTDSYLHLKKYEDYKMLDKPSNGISGKKEVFIEDLYFHFVPDSNTRQTGLQTGLYDIVNALPVEDFEKIKQNEDINLLITLDGKIDLYYNKAEGPFADKKVRQAVNAAIDAEEVLMGLYPSEELYRVDNGYMHKENEDWYTDAGKGAYNQKDIEKAKALLQESSYDGEEITILASHDYPWSGDTAIILQQQLQEIGMNVTPEFFDWPTVNERFNDPANFDIYIGGTGFVEVPSQLLPINPSFAGWTNDEKIDELKNKIRQEMDKEKAKQIWEELQAYLWEDYLPVTTIGHRMKVAAVNNNVEGVETFDHPIYWNVKVIKQD